MTKLTGHFDGKVLVPDQPVDLPTNERLVIHVEPERKATTLKEMLDLAEKLGFSRQDIREMNEAIEQDCEQVDADEW